MSLTGNLLNKFQQQANKISKLGSNAKLPLSGPSTRKFQPVNVDQWSFDIGLMYKKLKAQISCNQNINRNIVTCFKAAYRYWHAYSLAVNKTPQFASQTLKKLKIIEKRLNEQLDQTIVHSNQPIAYIRQVFSVIIKELEKKSKKYWQYQKQLNDAKPTQIKDKQQHQQQVKEEMLDIVQKFKQYALQIGSDLKKDNSVLESINQKQDRQLISIKKKSTDIKQLMKSQKIGFFELLTMALVAIALWIFCMFFIIII